MRAMLRWDAATRRNSAEMMRFWAAKSIEVIPIGQNWFRCEDGDSEAEESSQVHPRGNDVGQSQHILGSCDEVCGVIGEKAVTCHEELREGVCEFANFAM
jgi:hypothetical protein